MEKSKSVVSKPTVRPLYTGASHAKPTDKCLFCRYFDTGSMNVQWEEQSIVTPSNKKEDISKIIILL